MQLRFQRNYLDWLASLLSRENFLDLESKGLGEALIKRAVLDDEAFGYL